MAHPSPSSSTSSRSPSPAVITDHLKVDGVSHGYGDRRVLTDIDLVVGARDRVGLIGENGAGKSTLLRLIAGIEVPDAGAISRPASTGLLWQEVQLGPSATVQQVLEHAVADQRRLIVALESAASALASDPGDDLVRERYSDAIEVADRADVWNVETRRAVLLAGLGVDTIPGARRLDEVSGGQRSRLALAALHLSRPEALLLDEPTNHLDDGAVEFLATQVRDWRGPVLLASHDRAFLDEVTTALVDIDPSPHGARRYGGTGTPGVEGPFSEYLAVKAAERRRWEERFAGETEEAERLDHAVAVTAREIAPGRARRDGDKMQYDFKSGTHQRQVARRVRNVTVRREDLERSRIEEPPATLDFSGIPSGSQALPDGEPLITLRAAGVVGRLAPLSLDIGARDRLLVTGSNGSGKSTALAVIAGRVAADDGVVRRRRGLRIAMLDQDVRFEDPTLSARELYARAAGAHRAETVPLAGFGLLAERDLDRPVGDLSIGQQRRVALATVIARPPHLFLLDEPTNHLSLALAGELEEALGSYPGAVVLASHDRWLRRRWTGGTVPLEQGEQVGGRRRSPS